MNVRFNFVLIFILIINNSQKWFKKMSLIIRLNLCSGLVIQLLCIIASSNHYSIDKSSCYSIFVNVIETAWWQQIRWNRNQNSNLKFFKINSGNKTFRNSHMYLQLCIRLYPGKVLLQHNKIFMASFFSEPFCRYWRQKSDIQH